MTEQSMDTKIAVLEAKVEHMMIHTKELTLRVRANEKVVASISLLGVIACTFIGAGYFAPKAEACSPRMDGKPTYCPDWDDVILERPKPVAVFIPEEEENPYTHKVTLYDTRVAHMGHDFPTWPTAGEMIQAIREQEAESNRISIEDMLDASLVDFSNNQTIDEE